MKDFFISYNKNDRSWAEWIAWHLEEAGYTTVLQAWDFRPGSNFVQKMQDASDSERTIAVLSPDYLTSIYTQPEWQVAFSQDPTGLKGALLPVLIRQTDLKGLLNQIIYIDLVGLNEMAAQSALLDGIGRNRAKPTAPPTFPGLRNHTVEKPAIYPGNKSSLKPPVSDPIQLVNKGRNKPLSVTLVSPPPSRLWANIIGWFQYRRLKALREEIFEKYRKTGLTRPLISGFDTPFKNFESRSDPAMPAGRVLIINGPAGVGKTTYLDQLFRGLIGVDEESSKVDLFVKINARDLDDLLRQGDDLRLWHSIYSFFIGHATVTAQGPLTPAAVAYALNRKRVLLIIEDLHLAVSSEYVLKFFQSYFSKYHRWERHISVLGTTRERLEKLPEVLIETLRPIGKKEAQLFFYHLCIRNGLAKEKLTEHGDALARAFDAESLQAPLFVVICASLAAHPIAARLDMGRVLRMNTPELFSAFINQLYARSSLMAEKEGEFRDTYEHLALALWPAHGDFDPRDVADLLSKVAKADSPFDVESLEANGFLRRDMLGKLSFPHQAMAEYLAAAAMVRSLQFEKLRENSHERVETLVPFLADLIKAPEARALQLLAQANPRIFVDLVTSHSAAVERRETKPWTISSLDVASAVREWIISPWARRQPRETWERLRDIFDSTGTAGWVEAFCAVTSSVDTTGPGVEAMAIVGREAAHDVLKRWLKNKQGIAAFAEVVETPEVHGFLLALTSSAGLGTDLGQRAFGVLSAFQDPAVRDRLVRVIEKKLDRFTDQELEFLIKMGIDAQAVIGYACEEQSDRLKRRLSSQFALHIHHVLVPPAQYIIDDENHKKVRVTVKKPILIPCLPEHAGKRTSSQAQVLIDRKVGVKKLMTKELALVVLQYFQHVLPEKYGLIFARAKEGEYEALLDRQKVGLFYFYEDTLGNLKLASIKDHASGGVQGGRDVVYRAVKEL